MTEAPRRIVRFSTFELDLRTGELRKAGMRVSLQDHSRRVLVHLLERPGELVTREELQQRLWPADTFVDFELGVNTAVKRLRDVLGDSASTPRFIETLPRRGYRFIAPVEHVAEAAQPVVTPKFGATVWVPVGLLLATLAAFPIWWRPGTPSPSVTYLLASVAPGERLLGAYKEEQTGAGYWRPSRTAVALSPDGRMLAFSAHRHGKTHIYLRRFDQIEEADSLTGTEGGEGPFFSPDGRWLGFWAGMRIKKVPVSGGAVIDICETRRDFPSAGASWGSDDVIVFAYTYGGLWQVPATGGDPAPLTTTTAGEASHRLPHVLPGARAVLFTVMRRTEGYSGDAAVHVIVRGTGERRRLVEKGADARYVSSGHLVYARAGTLLAAPFDPGRLRLTGPEFGVLENVMHADNAGNWHLNTGAAQVTFSETGTIAFVTGGPYPDLRQVTPVWVDRTGENPVAVGQLPGGFGLRLSPDGNQFAFMSKGDLWGHDLQRGVTSRLTMDGTDTWPVWTPDGRLTFSRSIGGAGNLYRMDADGRNVERLTTDSADQVPASWTVDESLVFLRYVSEETPDIWRLWFDDGQWREEPVVESSFRNMYPAVHPDGRWLAYASDKSGRFEVYVRPFPGPGREQLVSRAGGHSPAWSHDGKKLFYLAFGRPPEPGVAAIMTEVPVSNAPGGELSLGEPKELFASRYLGTTPIRSYDVALDGRFLMLLREEPPPVPAPITHIIVGQNWLEELNRPR